MNKQIIQKWVVLFFFIGYFSAVSQTHISIWGSNPVDKKKQRSELIYYPSQGNNNSGVSVVVCPGGSYCYLAMNTEGKEIALRLNQYGINVFVLRYRVGIHGNRYPAMIEDLQRSIQLVKENATQYHIDPNKVGVMGFSAGGHLVGTLATYFNIDYLRPMGIKTNLSLKPAFCVMIYPVVSMEDSIAHRKSRRNLLSKRYTKEMQRMMSLEQNVHKQMPPIFLLQCKDDKTVDYRNSVNFDRALSKEKVPHTFLLFQDGGHGFGILRKKSNGDVESWDKALVKWIEQTLNTKL